MSVSHRAWIVKTEPGAYSFETLLKEGRTAWTGIRNFAARNYLREMNVDDVLLVYHTGAQKAVVGLAAVSRAAYPDPSAPAGEDWSAVDVVPLYPLAAPVPLSLIRDTPALAGVMLLTHERLSVVPVRAEELAIITALGRTPILGGPPRLAPLGGPPGASEEPPAAAAMPARPAARPKRGTRPKKAPRASKATAKGVKARPRAAKKSAATKRPARGRRSGGRRRSG
jgi:predicted RNA-binding protein with PUA-like domain